MKNKLTFVSATLIALILFAAQHVQAQWRLAGNNLAGNEKLGSLNNFPVTMVTNNIQRIQIDTSGHVTVGLNAGPSQFLQFGTSAWMKFPRDQYIWRHSNSQEGMYSNYTSRREEIRDSVAVPTMWFEWTTTGRTYFKGNMGIGANPNSARLFVKGINIGELARFDGGNQVFNSIYENGLYRGYWGSFAGNAEDVDFGTGSGNATGKLHLTIQGSPKATVDAAGRMGIGTVTPEGNLHVFRGSAGTVTANANAPLVVENSTSNFINLITPDANERGVLFGDNLNVQDGGIIYNGANQLQLRGNGNQNRVIIDPDGNTGINLDPTNTSSFNDAMLQVRNDGDDNLRLVAADNVNDWSFYSQDGALGVLSLYKNGAFRGSFNATTGVYSPISDEKLKKDVTELPEIMEKLMQLKPRKYHFRDNTTEKNFSYGFIAQQVNEVFPEFVTTVNDRKTGGNILTVNYDNFGVIAIKAIQELQDQIKELKKTVDKLSQGNSENAVSKTSIKFNVTALQQNNPNPVAGSTNIVYNIPAGSKNAQLVITNFSGNVIKRIALNSEGKGSLNIDASSMINGTYTYSLLADGKMVDSKKMIVSH